MGPILPIFFLLAFLPILAVHGLFGRTKQYVAVKGVLMCNGKPSVGTKVKLYDDDIGRDDNLAVGKTDAQGHFLLKGHTKEFTKIDPKLNVYHKCNHPFKFCSQKFSIWLPKNFISKKEYPIKVFDTGVLNLNGKFGGQSRDCFN